MLESRIFATLMGIMLAMPYPASATPSGGYFEPLAPQIAEALAAAKKLPAERQTLLRPAADAIGKQLADDKSASLIFICTANSRRSQLAQVWAKVAASHFELDGIQTFSGGTEATACNPRALRALRRAGFSVVTAADGDNPRYLVQFAENQPTIELYSKRFTDKENPQQNFVALFCCDDADEACPVVSGAAARVRLSYADPKQADGTDGESQAYDERSQQIAAEMFFLMSEVARRK
jgi:arsenate reductase